MISQLRASTGLCGCRAIARTSLLLGLLVCCGVSLAPADGAAQSPAVTVYHSSDEAGADPRPALAPGCSGLGTPQELIANGGFETGTLASWTLNDLPGGDGSMFVTGALVAPTSLLATVGPKSGSFYATSDQLGPGTHVLAQSFSVPGGASSVSLHFDMFVNNWADVVTTGALDHTVEVVQFGTVDIVDAAAFALDPFTTNPADIAANLFLGADPGAIPNAYTSYDFAIDGVDLTEAVADGSDFVLRFAESDNQSNFNMGFDDVSLQVAGETCIIQGGPDELLELWIDGGPSAGGAGETVCKMGDGGGSGDQLCGADILLQLTGVGEFTRFDPDGAMDTLVCSPCSFDEELGLYVLPPDTQQLRLNFRRGDASPGVGPRHLGTLEVDSTGLVPPAVTRVTAFGEAAGAALQLRSYASAVEPELVATSDPTELPEPGWLLQLSSGLLGLAALRRLRGR